MRALRCTTAVLCGSAAVANIATGDYLAGPIWALAAILWTYNAVVTW